MICGAASRRCIASGMRRRPFWRAMPCRHWRSRCAETAATPLSLAQITALQAGKTGALIEWAALAGPRMAQENTENLHEYSRKLGLAFQIADDILDIEGDAATVGKAVGKDAEAGKATFVSHLGLDGAKRRAQELVLEATDALSVYGKEADTLRACAQFVIARKK